MTKPKKCGVTCKHVHDTYALTVCPKHMEETQKKGLTLVQHEQTEEDPHGLLVGIGKGSRFIKR